MTDSTALLSRNDTAFVVGMKAEARILRSAGFAHVAVAAGSRGRARAEAGWLLGEHGCMRAVSFGIAGGLAPALVPGDLVIDGEEAGLVATLTDALRSAGLRVQPGKVETRDIPLADPHAKALLHARTGALAVDMETAGLIGAAESARAPWLVLRAIADPADTALPAFALAGMDEHGSIRVDRVLAALVTNPRDVSALFALARQSGAARRTLIVTARELAGH